MPLKDLELDFYKHVPTAVHGPACCSTDTGRGYGNSKAKIMFVGISPAHTEKRLGMPMVGDAGVLMNNLLEAVGLRRQDTYCTNMVCKYKTEVTIEDVQRCSSRLHAEIRLFKPKVIVLLGDEVSQFIMKRPFSKLRGSVTWHEEFNAYVLCTNHPAAIFHSLYTKKASEGMGIGLNLYRDFKKIKAILEWPEDNSLNEIDYTVINTIKDAQDVLDSIPAGSVVSLDVETTSRDIDEVDVYDDRLLCFAITFKDKYGVEHTYVFAYSAIGPQLIWPIGINWLFHNGQFDTQVIYRHLKTWLPIVEDTMMQSYSVEERGGFHGLKPLSREYLAAGFYEEDRKSVSKHMEDAPPDVLHLYNAKDARNTYRLHPVLLEQQIDDNTQGFYKNILIPAMNVYARTQYHGVAINSSMLDRLIQEWGAEYLRRIDVIVAKADAYGLSNYNLDSPKQTAKLFYDLLGLPHIPGKGNSTDAEVLEILADYHPLVSDIRNVRRLGNMITKYVVGVIPNLKVDRRVHPIAKMHGTTSGRPAYSKPNLQNIPQPYEKEEYDMPYDTLRQLYKATSDDMVLIEADFGKAEIWTGYYYSGDKHLHEDLLSGDYHKNVASKSIFHKPVELISGPEKTTAKKVTFLNMYGGGAFMLAKQLHQPEPVCDKYIRDWFNYNNDYSAFCEQVKRDLLRTGELVTKTGRKRRFMIIEGATELDNRTKNQALNYNIQSTASDCLVTAFVNMYYILSKLGIEGLFTVHDSIVFECPRKLLELALSIIHEHMTSDKLVAGMGPIPVDIKVSSVWGLGESVHNCEDKNSCLYHNYGIEPKWDLDKVA